MVISFATNFFIVVSAYFVDGSRFVGWYIEIFDFFIVFGLFPIVFWNL